MICQYCGCRTAADDLLHRLHCDGRQGAVEAALEPVPRFTPLIVAGAVPETWSTSEAAAERVTDKDTQRAEVLEAIRAAGARGMTDDELQIALGLEGNSERPRRWELWKRDAITIRRDAEGAPVRRLTRTQRHAVVWVEVDV